MSKLIVRPARQRISQSILLAWLILHLEVVLGKEGNITGQQANEPTSYSLREVRRLGCSAELRVIGIDHKSLKAKQINSYFDKIIFHFT